MVFSSLTFLCFFLTIVFALYLVSPDLRVRNGVLLVFSLLFYAWGEPIWVLGMVFTTVVNFVCALAIAHTEGSGRRKLLVFIAVAVSLAFLLYFKYAAFLVNSVTGILGISFRLPAQRLPIGISFYTFQAITYTVDVYRGRAKAQGNPLLVLLFICFFPQLIAGPIVQYGDIAERLNERSSPSSEAYQGFVRFIIGLSKKVLLANMCGEALNLLPVAGGGKPLSLLGSWLSMTLFALQIYFDFSGYSDMGIGMGRMFGFRFLENFNYPYISKSISEFWQRWHMSLGAFFRDYVYIPLGGNRVSKRRLALNLMAVWMLTGLWHGASWNFVAWGAYYGVLIILERLVLERLAGKIPGALRVAGTLILVLFGWALFYYESLPAGLAHIGAMLGFSGGGLADPVTAYVFKHNVVLILASIVCCLPWIKWSKEGKHLSLDHDAVGILVQPALMSALLLLSVLFLVGQSFNPFLYFRF
ncbi:MAG: MBOAT family protein [Peptococcaceae bacterium]|jgi:alginate O-acetyltransferase complex protein AlgI|nr:MBOAT family protein [Peptococcaceae bacterium]